MATLLIALRKLAGSHPIAQVVAGRRFSDDTIEEVIARPAVDSGE